MKYTPFQEIVTAAIASRNSPITNSPTMATLSDMMIDLSTLGIYTLPSRIRFLSSAPLLIRLCIVQHRPLPLQDNWPKTSSGAAHVALMGANFIVTQLVPRYSSRCTNEHVAKSGLPLQKHCTNSRTG